MAAGPAGRPVAAGLGRSRRRLVSVAFGQPWIGGTRRSRLRPPCGRTPQPPGFTKRHSISRRWRSGLSRSGSRIGGGGWRSAVGRGGSGRGRLCDRPQPGSPQHPLSPPRLRPPSRMSGGSPQKPPNRPWPEGPSSLLDSPADTARTEMQRRPHRLVAQDVGFSVRKPGFDSPWGYCNGQSLGWFEDIGGNQLRDPSLPERVAAAFHDLLLRGDVGHRLAILCRTCGRWRQAA